MPAFDEDPEPEYPYHNPEDLTDSDNIHDDGYNNFYEEQELYVEPYYQPYHDLEVDEEEEEW